VAPIEGIQLELFLELVVLRVVEVEYQGQGDQEAEERDRIGEQLDEAGVRRRKQQQHQ
jgi:hypothetical protein